MFLKRSQWTSANHHALLPADAARLLSKQTRRYISKEQVPSALF